MTQKGNEFKGAFFSRIGGILAGLEGLQASRNTKIWRAFLVLTQG